MSLRLPSEVVVERFLPTARAMLATELHDRGFTQTEIADRLGLTQAAVSKYLRGDVTIEDRFADDERMQATIAAIAEGFADESMDGYEALSELLGLVATFEDRGPICAVHEEEMPALAGLGCDLCVRGADDAVLTEREVLSAVRRGARRIANDPAMAEHVPNVGTNVGTAVPDATDATDVAAVPGRLQAVNGRILVPSDPEFGASERVAETIRAAMAVDPAVRGALNLATSEGLLDAARERGIDPLAFDADYEARGQRLRDRFRERGGVPHVAYHEGAFGIDPVAYVFGETATEAADLAVALAESARTE